MTTKDFLPETIESKTQNPKYLAFYLHNFRFYFSGFSVALWCFMILFVLWFFSFNKSPQLLNNPKILSYKAPQAFGALPQQEAIISSSEVIETMTIPFSYLEVDSSNLRWEFLERWSSAILSNAVIQYHIWEQQIPKYNTSSLVGKAKSWNSLELNQLIKYLHLPEISLSSSRESTINSINFFNEKQGYQFNLDLTKGKFWLKKQDFASEEKLEKKNEQPPAKTKKPSEKSIKKAVKNQISSFWLSLKYYGDPKITTDEYDPEKIHLFYPKIIDKKVIRNKETLEQEGMYISYDLQKQEIISLQNFQFQAYELSEYPIAKTKKALLNELSQLGNIDNSKKWKNSSIPMGKGQEIYLKDWNFLIPWLLFLSESEGNEGKVFLPLY